MNTYVPLPFEGTEHIAGGVAADSVQSKSDWYESLRADLLVDCFPDEKIHVFPAVGPCACGLKS